MEKRISGNIAIVLVLFAACIDLSQVLLEWIIIGVVVNPVLDIGVGFLFHRVLKSYGVNFKGTIALVFFGLAFFEFFPVIDEFPLWTIDIIAIIVMTRAEDKLTSKFGGSKAREMMQDPRRLRRIGKVAMNNINRVPVLKKAMDKKIAESGKKTPSDTNQQGSMIARSDQDNVTGTKTREQNKNIPENRRLGSGSKENIKKDEQKNKRDEIVQQQRDDKQKNIERSNREEYGSKENQTPTADEDFNKQKSFKFKNDFGRQNNSRPQSERDIIEKQRLAKLRPDLRYIRNVENKEPKKAA